MENKITNEEYTFSTLSDMYKFLNSKNVDAFLIDFGGMLKEAIHIREEVIKNIPIDQLDSISSLDDILDINTFSWIDDGIHDNTKSSLIIDFIVPDEGEEEYKNHQM